jgi:hypothetical protein
LDSQVSCQHGTSILGNKLIYISDYQRLKKIAVTYVTDVTTGALTLPKSGAGGAQVYGNLIDT